ncbi:hypothetical protein MEO93_30025 [Dolichospermum sp. ST_sed3]|nr:hypothetical protein [Dolichospermum sp. ST_sed3]
MATPVLTQIVEQVKSLPDNLQHQVLAFVHTLRTIAQRGTSGSLLLQFAGGISMDDIASMREAIENDCEQVDRNEW